MANDVHPTPAPRQSTPLPPHSSPLLETMLASDTRGDRDGAPSRTEKRNRKKYAKKKEREKVKSTTTREHFQAIFDVNDELPSNALYEVQISHLSGLGLYAVRDIPAGTLILSETAMMHHKGSERRPPEVISLFNALSEKDKAAYFCLPRHEDRPKHRERTFDKDILDIYHNNALLIAHTSSLCLCPPDQDNAPRAPTFSRAIFRNLSLLNHSCVPNTTISFLKVNAVATPTASLRANRAITAGEELTMSYPLLQDDRISLPFVCRCPLCSPNVCHARPGPGLPAYTRPIKTSNIYTTLPHSGYPPRTTIPTLKAAELRAELSLNAREHLASLLTDAENSALKPAQRVKLAEDALVVMAKEGIDGVDVGRVYAILADCHSSMARTKEATLARKMQVAVFETCLGRNHPVTARARALLLSYGGGKGKES
ncbi:hypothetical protein MBLNU457_6866t1 [Dothideomycetes sp. NU457]